MVDTDNKNTSDQSEWTLRPNGDGYYQLHINGKTKHIIEVEGDKYYIIGALFPTEVKYLTNCQFKKIVLEKPPKPPEVPEYEKPGVVWKNFPEGEGPYWCKNTINDQVLKCDIIKSGGCWEMVLYIGNHKSFRDIKPAYKFVKRTVDTNTGCANSTDTKERTT